MEFIVGGVTLSSVQTPPINTHISLEQKMKNANISYRKAIMNKFSQTTWLCTKILQHKIDDKQSYDSRIKIKEHK